MNYDDFFDLEDDQEDDEYFSEIQTCRTPGCIMPGAHFASECHTAEDVENYYRAMELECDQ
jgi:hypothetical protein